MTGGRLADLSEMIQEMAPAFSAKVYKYGINPCVDAPLRVSRAFGKRGYVPVTGTLNGEQLLATLCPMGGGRHRLYLNGEMRKRANVGAGDRVRLVLALDTQPRTLPMPGELREAFRRNPAAKRAFARLRRSDRNDILAYLNSLRRPETVRRNVEKVMRRLLEPL